MGAILCGWLPLSFISIVKQNVNNLPCNETRIRPSNRQICAKEVMM